MYQFLCYFFLNAHWYHLVMEGVLCLGIVWLLFTKSYNIKESVHLSKAEEEELIRLWQPQPLVPHDWEMPESVTKRFNRHIKDKMGKYVELEGDTMSLLNVASFNFLNFIGDADIERVTLQALAKYGVGSCGPRGFYGTMDAHLALEDKIANFMGLEEAVVYSYGFCTISTIIPAYSKRNDLIFADEGVSFAIQQGIIASRSTVIWFRHNDMEHLESLLKEQQREDAKNTKKAAKVRKFIVIEGLYLNTGHLCPLPQVITLKYRYKVRIFIDETISFGCLGATGRGVTEHFNVDPYDVDLISGSLEAALGASGGFSVGTRFVMNHQRLSAQGYTFSASLPPLMAAAATEAISKLEEMQTPDSSPTRGNPQILQEVSKDLHSQLCSQLYGEWNIESHEVSPIKHLRLRKNNNSATLEQVVDFGLTRGVMFTTSHYVTEKEHKCPQPSLRLAINCDLSTEEMDKICFVLKESISHIKFDTGE